MSKKLKEELGLSENQELPPEYMNAFKQIKHCGDYRAKKNNGTAENLVKKGYIKLKNGNDCEFNSFVATEKGKNLMKEID